MHNTIILASSMQTTRRRTRRLRVFLSGRPWRKIFNLIIFFCFTFTCQHLSSLISITATCNMWVAAVFKPFLLLWAGLKAIDDLAGFIKLSRLFASVVPFPGKTRDVEEMCGLCDDIGELNEFSKPITQLLFLLLLPLTCPFIY